jgi:hypothetical protein
VIWQRDNLKRYRTRESCQRACDYLNRRLLDRRWREPVISLDGEYFEMWSALRAEAFEGDPDAPDPEAGPSHPPRGLPPAP